MFKAVNLRTREDVVIIHPAWTDRIDVLRDLDRANVLVCQECQQPVRVRAGELRRRHFAHKHRLDCPLGYESPELLLARAVLYRRLLDVFGERAHIEKRLGSTLFPRPVDCWVERERGSFAYWITNGQIQPPVRSMLRRGFAEVGVHPQWMFIAGLQREAGTTVGSDLPCLHLTTTEREFLETTYFDLEATDTARTRGGSIHYLDPEAEVLTTYRSLRLIHAPQLFAGRRLQSPLAEVLFAPRSGDPAHQGERERTLATIKERYHLESVRCQDEERVQMAEDEAIQALDEAQAHARRAAQGRTQYVHPYEYVSGSHPALTPMDDLPADSDEHPVEHWRERSGTCIYCGVTTDSWVSFDGATNTCKCRSCVRSGRG